MSKNILILELTILTIVGSLFMALASNMFFDDIFNIGAGMQNSTLPVTLPAASVALIFVLAIFYLLRTYKHPDCKKRISKLYLIIAGVLGLIGLIGVILSAAVVYHNFAGSHPFPGYLIIFMILDLAIIGGSVCGFLFLKKLPEDEGKVTINFLYVLKTIGWFLFVSMIFNRFGMLLGCPTYIYLRNLYQTFPFYLYLLVPLFLGVLEVLHILGILKGKKMLILIIVGVALNVVIFAYSVIMGLNDTAFISSLSQLMPLERMGSMPMEIMIQFLSYLGVGVALFLQYRKTKEE